MKIKNLILIGIIVLAAILRLWKLGSIPPSLTPDEAALGYNAYSVLHTAKDEYGQTLPIIFKSFGDYKPGLYVYLSIPSIAVLGLNEFSTRLPSALFGILSVYLIYLIVRKMFASYESQGGGLDAQHSTYKLNNLSLIAAFIAAINPYLIYFSRGAWEANVSLTLTLAGIYLFLKALENHKLLVLSAAFFASTLLTYQGAKLSTFIVLVILAFVYFSECKKFFASAKKTLAVSTVLGLIIVFPVLLTLFNGQTQRLTIFSIFSYRRPTEVVAQILEQGNEKTGGMSYLLFHSENLNYVRSILSRYFNTVSGAFLFFEGDSANPVHTAPYQGVLLLSNLILLPLGFFVIYKNKLDKGKMFFVLWFALAPLSSAISRDQTNAVRSLNLAVPLVVVISFGLMQLTEWLSKKTGKFIGIGIIAVIYIISFAYFADAYYIHVPAHNSQYWRYGYKQAVEYIINYKQSLASQSPGKNIVFEQSFNQPYIYYLFFGPKDPAKYQKQENLVNSQYIGDVGFVEKINNINFKQIDWQVLKHESGTLVIASPISLPPDFSVDAKLLEQIKYLNGRDVAFDIIEIK